MKLMKLHRLVNATSLAITITALQVVHAQNSAPATNVSSNAGGPSASPPDAPASTDDGLAEIVVTAQKRAENLQKVPIAVTAVSGDEIAQRGINTLFGLTALTPNLTIASTFGNTNPQITLRGIGSDSFNQTTESTVALYLDEFVLNPQSSKLGQLFDLERVEVLRGPQGTLYGKNSTGGAINFVSRKPDGTYEMDGSVTMGRFGEYDVAVGAQAPINDELSARVAVQERSSDGYGFDVGTDTRADSYKDWAGRILLRDKRDDFDATLKLFFDTSRGPGTSLDAYPTNPVTGAPIPSGVNAITGFKRPNDIDVFDTNIRQSSLVNNEGVTLNAEQDFGGIALTSITGYLFSKSNIIQDTDDEPVDLAKTDPYDASSTQITQELRLSSIGDQRFSWIAGASFFHQVIDYNDTNNFAIFGFPDISWVGQDKTTSFAGFVDGTFHVNDRLSFVGGVRATTDDKDWREQSTSQYSLVAGNNLAPYDAKESHRWTEPTYRAGGNYQLDPDSLLYVSYNHGYRAGAYDSGFKSSPSQFVPVNPEFVNSYEGGVKTTMLDNHLRFSTDVFYQKFENQQTLVPNSLGICCAVVNAGRSHIYGWELEGVARITSNFDVNFSSSITRSKYEEFNYGNINYAGIQLENVPRYQIRISPEYLIPFKGGNLFAAPEAVFMGSSRLDAIPDPYGQDIQRAYHLINAQAGWRAPEDNFSVFAFVKNATDERYRTYYQDIAVYGLSDNVYSPPMTFGLTTTFRF
jgi:iron complex outermembrane recepter protein